LSASKIKSSGGFLEGEGVFRDYNGSTDGKPVFETQDPFEWETHCREAKLTTSGSSPCAICSKVTEFENLAYGKKPVCAECRETL